MNEGTFLQDAKDRLLAQTTWDRNVVVVAGAGTGKTTILVNRILNLLMREPQPLAITEIVALTFTNKAATEMKQRLRRELSKLIDRSDDALLTLFRSRYQLTSDQVTERAEQAWTQLEKAQIGTLHSFAAHLLRLHPLESGLDPAFQEDDGTRFKELFDARWNAWIADELGQDGQSHDRWRRVLSGTDLEALRSLAVTLGGESLDLQELARQCHSTSVDDSLRDWLNGLREHATSLLASRANAKQLKAEKMLAAAAACFATILELGPDGVQRLSEDDRAQLGKKIDKPAAGWDARLFSEAKDVVSVAQQLLSVDQGYFGDLLELLLPFLLQVRQSFLASGWISFDGLLNRAKTLLRNHPSVRARVKHSYRAILVDEFQDTDPVQYEIVLYLAERSGSAKMSWHELDLEPGKLFIVGDPKQSIYAFRRADIEAFERVVEKIVAGGGAVYSLVTNFRSDGAVLSVANDLFDRLFQPESHVQPANERLTPQPQRKSELSVSGVQLRLVTAGGDEEEFDAATATRAEADQLARWIKEELLPGTTIYDRDRIPGPLQPGHIALIFRKLTQAQDYLEALRRYGIAYVTDGEKHFYRRQEIIDLVSVLRVIDNPHDRIALVGLLRSPLGGVQDRDLLALQQLGALDITQPHILTRWAHPQATTVRGLYERLAELHRTAPLCPVPDVLDILFERLPILELAAASLHGEQAVANLLKVRSIAEAVADRPHLTLTRFVDLMMERLADQPEETESALSESSLDAVRILTIHKAKGLEFPVVVLPGLHQGARASQKGSAVQHDWSSRCYGLSIGSRRNMGSVLVGTKMAAREEAEQRRLLYVGMTRARDLLVLSGGYGGKPGRDTVLSLLQEAIGEDTLAGGDCATIEFGSTTLTKTTLPATTTRRHRPEKSASTFVPLSPVSLLKRHASRVAGRSLVGSLPRHLTPSSMQFEKLETPRRPVERTDGERHAKQVGICAHAWLEEWDFARTSAPSRAEIETLCRRMYPQEIEGTAEIEDDLRSIIESFLPSESYSRMRAATILGREVPFTLAWGEGQIMEGVIDVIYRVDGAIWIADYKTDRVDAADVRRRAEQYAAQAAIYREAARTCLNVPSVSFEFIFLRPGVSVTV